MITINVKVYPCAKKQEIVKCEDLFGEVRYKVFLRSSPEGGKANKELITLIAACFNTKKHEVEIIKGEFNRDKVVKVNNL